MTTPPATMDTITLTLSLQCPAGSGAANMAALRAAFAQKYPELVTIVTGTDANGNPRYASDPAGVIERATVEKWFLAVFVEEAMVNGAAAAKAAALANLANITTTVTINNTPAGS